MSETETKPTEPKGMRWYVIQGMPGMEKKIAQQIKETAIKKGLIDQIADVLVPSEQVIETRRGQKITVDQKFFPGYILLRMLMTDEAWHLVRNTPKVTGFLGNKMRPTPMPDSDVERILKQAKEGAEKPRPSVNFEIGEQVRVAEGPFMSFNGTVEEVDERAGRLKVSVSIFGRATPVDLEYSQVQRV